MVANSRIDVEVDKLIVNSSKAFCALSLSVFKNVPLKKNMFQSQKSNLSSHKNNLPCQKNKLRFHLTRKKKQASTNRRTTWFKGSVMASRDQLWHPWDKLWQKFCCLSNLGINYSRVKCNLTSNKLQEMFDGVFHIKSWPKFRHQKVYKFNLK